MIFGNGISVVYATPRRASSGSALSPHIRCRTISRKDGLRSQAATIHVSALVGGASG